MTQKAHPDCIAGAKQVLRAVREGRIERIRLACDVDDYMRRRILSACADLPVEDGPSMKELGRECGISIGTSVVGVLKKPD